MSWFENGDEWINLNHVAYVTKKTDGSVEAVIVGGETFSKTFTIPASRAELLLRKLAEGQGFSARSFRGS